MSRHILQSSPNCPSVQNFFFLWRESSRFDSRHTASLRGKPPIIQVLLPGSGVLELETQSLVEDKECTDSEIWG